ncbi:MAG: GNAT family N-acetyltransferase [Clostridia bacterium]|nr:GNAT family N-acetyltransferase [Clostridia bacterium]
MDLDKIDYLGLDRVLKRGSGDTVAERDGALLIRDRISGAYMLACDDAVAGASLLDRHIGRDCGLLMVSDHKLGITAFEKYGFSEKLECFQTAYYGKKPPVDPRLSFVTAEEADLPMLTEAYRLISPEELERVVGRRSILFGYHEGRCVGFIGEHLEGSMGILYVFPEFRRRGFGAALQKHLISKTMDEGFIPFGQVEKDNRNSLDLQKKVGMTVSDDLIVWMWR